MHEVAPPLTSPPLPPPPTFPPYPPPYLPPPPTFGSLTSKVGGGDFVPYMKENTKTSSKTRGGDYNRS